ncbi:F-actin-monooxygenase MICAL2-like [Vombatus ursinus]|uniref:F-actin-monooxygenase MICAL2-like n=1 Tax=Vombatus ursinus TaxID=29139 RepID=UPI000FFD31AB|nr:F-actin-monooxygenase MICAL2-like [Vombatus ursinus]XP_027708295.1 F-actin-monooxygenase MICAL2-like [Vombatus ursinus]
MERLSAEGHFFHRECFRCEICSTTLRLAVYAFDADEGKFYCKAHFIHCRTNSKQRKRRAELKRQEEEEVKEKQQEAKWPDASPEILGPAVNSREASPPGIMTSFFRKVLYWPIRVTRDLLDIPRSLCNRIHGFLHETALHFRDNAYNYCYMYELLSLGVPLLCVLFEVLTDMYRETESPLQSVHDWVQQSLWVKIS